MSLTPHAVISSPLEYEVSSAALTVSPEQVRTLADPPRLTRGEIRVALQGRRHSSALLKDVRIQPGAPGAQEAVLWLLQATTPQQQSWKHTFWQRTRVQAGAPRPGNGQYNLASCSPFLATLQPMLLQVLSYLDLSWKWGVVCLFCLWSPKWPLGAHARTWEDLLPTQGRRLLRNAGAMAWEDLIPLGSYLWVHSTQALLRPIRWEIPWWNWLPDCDEVPWNDLARALGLAVGLSSVILVFIAAETGINPFVIGQPESTGNFSHPISSPPSASENLVPNPPHSDITFWLAKEDVRALAIPSDPDSVLGAPTITVSQIEAVLQSYHSPAIGKGKVLYDLGVKYGIDPAFGLAFFVFESDAGTRGVAVTTLSLGNIRSTPGVPDYKGYRQYNSWEEGMADWYRLIRKVYADKWNLTTVDQIIPVYAPTDDNNDIVNYESSVKRLVQQWRSSR